MKADSDRKDFEKCSTGYNFWTSIGLKLLKKKKVRKLLNFMIRSGKKY